MGHAVFKHPAVASTVGDDVVQSIGIDAFAQTQCHGFSSRSNVHTRQQLVDDFDFAPSPSMVAQLIDFARHGVQHGFAFGIGSRFGGGHHRHLAAGGFGCSAGNGSVNIMQTEFF